MKNEEIWFRTMSAVLAAAGVMLLVLGVLVSDRAIAGYCFGLGAASAALGVGYLLQVSLLPRERRDDIGRRKRIEVEDERNVSIRNRAGSAVNSVTTYALCVLIIGASLLGSDVAVVLSLVALMLARFALLVAFHNHYARST